jgi:hypothetical protein
MNPVLVADGADIVAVQSIESSFEPSRPLGTVLDNLTILNGGNIRVVALLSGAR